MNYYLIGLGIYWVLSAVVVLIMTNNGGMFKFDIWHRFQIAIIAGFIVPILGISMIIETIDKKMTPEGTRADWKADDYLQISLIFCSLIAYMSFMTWSLGMPDRETQKCAAVVITKK